MENEQEAIITLYADASNQSAFIEITKGENTTSIPIDKTFRENMMLLAIDSGGEYEISEEDTLQMVTKEQFDNAIKEVTEGVEK